MGKNLAKAIQIELPIPAPEEKRSHGGFREGAGRKRAKGRRRVAHAVRPPTTFRFPVHVTTRVRSGVGRLRKFELCKVLRRAFVRGCKRDGFRICQFSIQGNHIHLVCEARDATSLSRGMQGWEVRVARALNKALGRKGRVFDDRFHCEVIKSPRQTRAVLCYVMQNARRHGELLDQRYNGVDPFSSAWWFDGWRDQGWRSGVSPPEERSVAPAGSWLLNVGWRRYGLLEVDEVPAARRREERRSARRLGLTTA